MFIAMTHFQFYMKARGTSSTPYEGTIKTNLGVEEETPKWSGL